MTEEIHFLLPGTPFLVPGTPGTEYCPHEMTEGATGTEKGTPKTAKGTPGTIPGTRSAPYEGGEAKGRGS